MSDRAFPKPMPNPLPRYTSIGSEKGIFSAVEADGVYRFELRERPYAEPIRCDVVPELFQEALAANGRSVRITGECRYVGDSAIPESIKVEEFEVLPHDWELPTMWDLKDSMPDITGGLTVDEFLAESRGE